MDSSLLMHQQKLMSMQQQAESLQEKMGVGAVDGEVMQQQSVQVQSVSEQEKARRAVEQAMPPTQAHQSLPVVYRQADLDRLQHTDHMEPRLIEHVFSGEINRRGAAVGYHYEGVEGSRGHVISKRSTPDAHGVYTAKVAVDGVTKIANKGYSTFFPQSMSPQEVVDCVDRAYGHRIEGTSSGSQNVYCTGTDASTGIKIGMYVDPQKKMVTAFPIK